MMNAKRFQNLPPLDLSQSIPARDFRTVSISQIHLPHGKTEIPVEIEVTAGFAARLSYSPPWDGVFSGFIRENEWILQILGKSKPSSPDKRKISLVDWDDHFLMVCETGVPNEEKAFSVKPEDVLDLLENCLHAKPI